MFAIDIVINTGKESKEPYSIMHIQHTQKFSCSTKKRLDNSIEYILCEFVSSPTNRIAPTSSEFFYISSKGEMGKYYILIKPKYNIYLYPIENEIIYDDGVANILDQTSKHWILLGYKTLNPPLIKKHSTSKGLNFDINFNNTKYPSIGALNFNQEPIYFDTDKDIENFLKVKRVYEKGRYDDLIGDIDEYIDEAKESIFLSDFLYYKMKTLAKIGGENDMDELLSISKKWLLDYPSNENIAEVLRLRGKAYLVKTLVEEAERYFQLVIDEHKNTISAHKSMIDFGDLKLSKKDTDGAIKLYKKALYNTTDIETASIAAMRLAKASINKNELKKAAKYYAKIISANKKFLTSKPSQAWSIAKKMATSKSFLLAAQITEALYEKEPEELDDVREDMLVKIATWYYESGNIPKATKYFDEYIKLYEEDGTYVDKVKKKYDEMMFETAIDNDTEKFKRYDYLISTYNGQEIGNKAAYKKIKLLYDKGRFKEVLELEYQLSELSNKIAPDKSTIIENSVKALSEGLLDKVNLIKPLLDLSKEFNNKDTKIDNNTDIAKCKKVKDYIDRYEFYVEDRYDEKLFLCYESLSMFADAESIAKKYFKEKNILTRLEWMHKTQKLFKAQNAFKESIKISEDLIALSNANGITKYDTLLYDIFDAHLKKLSPEPIILDLATKITKKFPNNYKNAKLFNTLAQYASQKKDYLMTLSYSKKLIDLQDTFNKYRYTPAINFLYIQTLMNTDKLKLAREASKKLSKLNLSDKEKLQLQYLRANIFTRTGWPSKAKPLLEKCSDSAIKSKWVELCKESLKWVE